MATRWSPLQVYIVNLIKGERNDREHKHEAL